MVGVKQTAIRPGEVIVDLTLPTARGWQGYAKVGVRNAMVIAVASTCLAVDDEAERVAVALGSVAPTVVRCPGAEEHLGAAVDWTTGTVADDALGEFGRLVGAASNPITDHRSTADYRRHAVEVLARRLARRAFGVAGEEAA